MTIDADQVRTEFGDWLMGTRFSCLGARASVRRRAFVVDVFGRLGGPATAEPLHRSLQRFGTETLSEDEDFASYVALFDGPCGLSEPEFETLLWRQLSLVHEIDRDRFGWAERTSPDPESPDFAFSVAGVAYFVVGMHGGASRVSRRFRLPGLAFNAHLQFERLRERGTYSGLRDRIRARELRLQGSLQPHLADHGTESEAKQYAGRLVDPQWSCPWHPEADA